MTDSDTDLTTWTLEAIKSSGMVLEGACATEGCNEFTRFNIDSLIESFGANWLVPHILPVRCQACGARLNFQLAVLHDDETDD